jgi:hypothetical protein
MMKPTWIGKLNQLAGILLMAASPMLYGCGEMTVEHVAELPKPPAAKQESAISGGDTAQTATAIDFGTKYRIYLNANIPAKKKQYLKLNLIATTPIEQRLNVINENPHKATFKGRCTLYEKSAMNQYQLSLLKLGGAWESEAEGGEGETKVDVFSNAEILFEITADKGSGYLELDLEKY